MEVRSHDGSGRASAGWVALVLVALYSALLALVLSVGLVGVAALPIALAVIALGYRGVVRGWVAGRRVGWVALVIGGVGLLPALFACLFGMLICVLDGGVIASS